MGRSKSNSTARKNGRKLAPVHPGEILQKEFLEPMGLSQNRDGQGVRLGG